MKSQIFCDTQISREIKVGHSRTSKSAILTQLEAWNFYFHELTKLTKFRAPNSVQSRSKSISDDRPLGRF